MPAERLTYSTTVSDIEIVQGDSHVLDHTRAINAQYIGSSLLAYLGEHGACMVSTPRERQSSHMLRNATTIALEVYVLPMDTADNGEVADFRALHMGPPAAEASTRATGRAIEDAFRIGTRRRRESVRPGRPEPVYFSPPSEGWAQSLSDALNSSAQVEAYLYAEAAPTVAEAINAGRDRLDLEA